MATKATERDDADAAPEQQTDGPLLDLTDASVKRMVKLAKKRGYITYEEINEVLPEGQSDPDQLEDVLSQLSEMGINVVEAEETEDAGGDKPANGEASDDDDAAEGTEVAEIAPTKPLAVRETTAKEPTDRTDDPVRMYLREMGSVELLSREGEIAIAKRIEAGREAMIAGLCESPLTFQAIIIWRDELVDGRVLLRDIT
jgi:RNA polymerase primary sigma factor